MVTVNALPQLSSSILLFFSISASLNRALICSHSTSLLHAGSFSISIFVFFVIISLAVSASKCILVSTFPLLRHFQTLCLRKKGNISHKQVFFLLVNCTDFLALAQYEMTCYRSTSRLCLSTVSVLELGCCQGRKGSAASVRHAVSAAERACAAMHLIV